MKCLRSLLMLIAATGATGISGQVEPTPPARRLLLSSISDSVEEALYPFGIRVRGNYRVYADSIVVQVDSAMVVFQIKDPAQERAYAQQLQYSIGVGMQGKDGWTVEYGTQFQEIDTTWVNRNSTDTTNAGRKRFVIVTKGATALADGWLVAELRVKTRAFNSRSGFLTSFACAMDNVLGPTPASRARATPSRVTVANLCGNHPEKKRG